MRTPKQKILVHSCFCFLCLIVIGRSHYKLASLYDVVDPSNFEFLDPILFLNDREIFARARGGTSLSRSLEHVLEDRRKTQISIVLSHCDKSIEWVPNFIGEGLYDVTDITILSKCGNEIQGLESINNIGARIKVNVVDVENVGRCDHSFAYWIKNNIPDINEERDGKDLVLFMKDNDRLVRVSRTFHEAFAIASSTGFTCFRRPNGNDWSHKRFIPLSLHRKSRLDLFQIKDYDRTGDESNPNFAAKYRNLGEYREAIGIKYPDSALVPVCYGGMFMTQKRGLLKHPASVWTHLTSSLSRDNNIEEGHFAERLWATLVSPQLSDVALEHISESIQQKIDYEEDKVYYLEGLTYIRDWGSFFKRYTGLNFYWWNDIYPR